MSAPPPTPPFMKNCPWTILPLLFLIFQSLPPPGEVIKIYFPSFKKGRGIWTMWYHNKNTSWSSHQPHTPSFPIGLVKTESDFVWSVETGLGRLMLVLAVISVDAYHFLTFSDLTCYVEDTSQVKLYFWHKNSQW